MNADSIDELESHLRESVSELQRKGLSEEESFDVARKRLGCAPSLDAEFKKNSPWRANQDLLVWMLSGYLAISICGMLSNLLVSILSTGMAYAELGSTATGVVATLGQILFWIGVFVLAARARELVFVFGRNPELSLVAMFIAVVILPLAVTQANAAQATIADQRWMAETYIATQFGHFFVQFLLYAFCFIGLLLLRRSRRNLAVSG